MNRNKIYISDDDRNLIVWFLIVKNEYHRIKLSRIDCNGISYLVWFFVNNSQTITCRRVLMNDILNFKIKERKDKIDFLLNN